MMSKSDFEAIATVFRSQVDNLRDVQAAIANAGVVDTMTNPKAVTLETMACNMVQKFYASNSRFDHKKFYEACGFDIVKNYPRVFEMEA